MLVLNGTNPSMLTNHAKQILSLLYFHGLIFCKLYKLSRNWQYAKFIITYMKCHYEEEQKRDNNCTKNSQTMEVLQGIVLNLAQDSKTRSTFTATANDFLAVK